MRREGTFKQELKWNDQHFYSILVSEWEDRRWTKLKKVYS